MAKLRGILKVGAVGSQNFLLAVLRNSRVPFFGNTNIWTINTNMWRINGYRARRLFNRKLIQCSEEIMH